MTRCADIRRRNRRRLLASLVLGLVGLVATDLCVHRMLLAGGSFRGRVLPPFGVLDDAQRRELERVLRRLERGLDDAVVNAFDRDLGWTHRPGQARLGELGVHIGNLGQRGAEARAPTPADGALRVACFGASFTFGSGVADGDDWPARLEQELARTRGTAEVLNLGVGGYGIDQSLLRLEQLGTLGARVVTLGVHTDSIARNVNRSRALLAPGECGVLVKPRFVLGAAGELALVPLPFESRLELVRAALDGSVLARAGAGEHFGPARPWVPFSSLARLFALERARVQRDARRLWEDSDAEPYGLARALVERFVEVARERGAERVLVLFFPSPGDLLSLERGAPAPWDGFARELAAAGLEVLDLAPVLVQAAREGLPTFRAHHPTPRTHRAIALGVAERVTATLGDPRGRESARAALSPRTRRR